MWNAWDNYGDSYFESESLKEAIEWLELSEELAEEVCRLAEEEHCYYFDFGNGSGLDLV